MVSNGTRFSGRSVVTFVEDETNDSWLAGDIAAVHLVRDVVADAEAPRSCAGVAMARIQREIDHLWRDSLRTDDRSTSERLAEVSHALHRAALLLERDDVIG